MGYWAAKRSAKVLHAVWIFSGSGAQPCSSSSDKLELCHVSLTLHLIIAAVTPLQGPAVFGWMRQELLQSLVLCETFPVTLWEWDASTLDAHFNFASYPGLLTLAAVHSVGNAAMQVQVFAYGSQACQAPQVVQGAPLCVLLLWHLVCWSGTWSLMCTFPRPEGGWHGFAAHRC